MIETLQQWSHKFAKFMGDRTAFGVKTTSANISALDTMIHYESLTRLLPYESFDPDTGIFHNRGSEGFILEVFPLLGANEETINILSSLITDVLPPTADIQFLLWGSPKVGEWLDRFEAVRGKEGDIYAWLAKKRTDYLKQGVFKSLTSYSDFMLRDVRCWVSVSEPCKADQDLRDHLIVLRDAMVSSLKSIQAIVTPVNVQEFMCVMADLLHPTANVYPSRPRWNPYGTLADQLIDHEGYIRVFDDKLQFNNEECFEARCLSVKEYPSSMAQWDMTNAIGKLFNDSLQIPCPLCCHFQYDSLILKKQDWELNCNL